MANVLLTMLHELGVDDIDRIGDSTGALAFSIWIKPAVSR